MNRLLVIVGPTAVGKSGLAMQLARRFGCEIISGDSMCVYRGLDIGTAKPSLADRREISHHLIDIRQPEEDFSVVDFQQLAGAAIEASDQRGRLPLLVGGTGLYVQALLEGYQFNPTRRNPASALQNQLETEETLTLHQRLSVLDQATAARIHPHDRKRVLRALEIFSMEEQSISRTKTSTDHGLRYNCLVLGITMERSELYRRIDARVDQMLADGLVEEVRALWQRDLTGRATALQAIGYKELIACFQGKISLEESVDQIKQSSRRYAKRQLTWFRRMPYIHWLERPADDETAAAVFHEATRQVAERFSIK